MSAAKQLPIPEAITIKSLEPLSIWVAWQQETDETGRLTKVPYSHHTRRQAATDRPTDWGTFAQAGACARLLPNPHGMCGVGLVLGTDMGNGQTLAGVDLDTCRNPETGAFEEWAVDAALHMGSYYETSPSMTGAKVFFTYNTADLPRLRAAMGGPDWGKVFKRAGGEHPPAIELFLGGKYFTTTGLICSEMFSEISHVPTETIIEMIKIVGPSFVGGGAAGSASASMFPPSGDGSRSGAAFSIGRKVRRNGGSFEQMCDAIERDERTAGWFHEKGEANGGRELRRIWDKADVGDVETDAMLAEFNEKYMVVNEGGKAIVYEPSFDPVLRRTRFDRIGFDDLNRLYMNQQVAVGTDDKGRPIKKNKAQVWLKHEDRRQYIGGVRFDPSGQCGPTVLNLWQGFAVEPRAGDWSLLREHVKSNICDGHDGNFDYLMKWMARMVQQPDRQGEVAVVMKGREGTGKGFLAKALLTIMGQHGIAINNSRHLVGNFNSHLRDVVLLFADEAFFAGDKASVGVLKSLITEPTLTIEGKYQNATQMPNYLHVMMASNEDWVVPAATDARRFFVLDVSEARKQDTAYFGAIMDQLKAGGYEAMLHDLLALDIAGFQVQKVPATTGLQEQKKLSLPTTEAWWMDCLARGYVFQSRLGLEEVFSEWDSSVSTALLYASYKAFADDKRERHPITREALGFFFKSRLCCETHRPRGLRIVGEHITDEVNSFGSTQRKAKPVENERPPGYQVGSLSEARAGFVSATGIVVKWGDDDEP